MNAFISRDKLGIADPTLAPSAKTKARKQLFAGLGVSVLLAGAGFAIYNAVFASKHVETDNAYVNADAAQVTALTGGPVAEVHVVDTQSVKKGDILVVLDTTDRQLELSQAEASLDQVERQVLGYKANNAALDGLTGARQADLIRARAELNRAKIEYDRRAPLANTGAISGEELTSVKAALESAQAAYAQAEANLRAAQGAHEANNVLISGTPLDQNPQVTAARFRVQQARVNLERTVVRAPVDGIVTQRSIQIGQMVQPGTPLMIVVPVQQAYVNANFKEIQLRDVHPGQPVTLKSDLYGDKVVYHGRVAGFSGGTGSALAIVPSQNATGNWIKVVQRLPVRVSLDPKELAAYPLKVGLSMTADIDVSH